MGKECTHAKTCVINMYFVDYFNYLHEATSLGWVARWLLWIDTN